MKQRQKLGAGLADLARKAYKRISAEFVSKVVKQINNPN